MKTVLLRPKPVEILLTLNGSFAKTLTELFKITHITYAHIVKITNKCEKNGMISKERTGRVVLITLTAKGKQVAKGLINIHALLDGENEGVEDDKKK